jgi:hypothetical protein
MKRKITNQLVVAFVTIALASGVARATDTAPTSDKTSAKSSQASMDDPVHFNSVDGDPIRSTAGH